MKNKKINKNIGLTFDFVRQLVSDPKKIENIPDQGEIEFIEMDFEENQTQDDGKRVFVKVKNTFEVIESSKMSKPEHKK